MADETYRAIDTPIGVLHGRTAIGLAEVEYDYDNGRLALRGRIDGYHASRAASDRWYAFDITFHEVLAFRMIELDSWYNLGFSLVCSSQFDEVINSEWRAQLGGKVKSGHHHYSLVTYDDAFDIICLRYEMTVNDVHDG